MHELKPCRKCGAPAANIITPQRGWTWLIHCSKLCGYHEHKPTLEETVAVWNARAELGGEPNSPQQTNGAEPSEITPPCTKCFYVNEGCSELRVVSECSDFKSA